MINTTLMIYSHAMADLFKSGSESHDLENSI